MELCRTHGWRRVACALDNWQHVVLGRYRLRLLCDVHDLAIGLTWKEARS